jgi:hypothetical protein
MSTSFISFLDELEYNKTFLFLKNEKIEDSPLKTHADGQPTHDLHKIYNSNSPNTVFDARGSSDETKARLHYNAYHIEHSRRP